jgi:hypothetical protein
MPNQFRMINHLSYPDKKQGSVNAGIPDEAAAVHYAGIYEAILQIISYWNKWKRMAITG